MIPTATVKLSKGNTVIRSARCPMESHQGRVTSDFLAPQKDFEGNTFWTFRCKHGGRPYHLFNALPAADSEEAANNFSSWKERQLASKKVRTLQ